MFLINGFSDSDSVGYFQWSLYDKSEKSTNSKLKRLTFKILNSDSKNRVQSILNAVLNNFKFNSNVIKQEKACYANANFVTQRQIGALSQS